MMAEAIGVAHTGSSSSAIHSVSCLRYSYSRTNLPDGPSTSTLDYRMVNSTASVSVCVAVCCVCVCVCYEGERTEE
jgi:hypothetical protein